MFSPFVSVTFLQSQDIPADGFIVFLRSYLTVPCMRAGGQSPEGRHIPGGLPGACPRIDLGPQHAAGGRSAPELGRASARAVR